MISSITFSLGTFFWGGAGISFLGFLGASTPFEGGVEMGYKGTWGFGIREGGGVRGSVFGLVGLWETCLRMAFFFKRLRPSFVLFSR
ncbi:hypothetical protein QBC41DRAFT_62493 [Cercophora samala]|uniref:Uncharacterized protein n=1 Tax=Cercophora samala TaxID=330535 RepID=A0AA40DEX8_9PEZI|nr:hypothetical protein QBC41DRAFT_62493 [Cercophora samala]